MVVLVGTAVVLAVWLLLVLGYAGVSRPLSLRPGPATMDLGSEPPAVVNLLVTRCGLNADAADATLLDLAARRILELHQFGSDPADLMVRVRNGAPAGLTTYERRVFDRVDAVAGSRLTPLQQVLDAYTQGGPGWYADLRREVIADAKDRGLVRSRTSGGVLVMLCMLTGMALAALWLSGLAGALGQNTAASSGHASASGALSVVGILCWFIAAPVVAVLLMASAAPLLLGLRPTEAGYDVGGRWLGVAAWLASHPVNADLPPAAVAVWDRYLAYGVALGVNPLAARALDLRAGHRVVLTSIDGPALPGGVPRAVQVRYRRNPLGYAQAGVQAMAAGLVLAGCLVWWPHAARASAAWHLGVRAAFYLPLALITGWAGYLLLRSVYARLAPVSVTGTVLAVHPWRPRQDATVNWIEFVVDDGRHDHTRPWLVRADRCPGLHRGDHIRFRAQPFTRFVLTITPSASAGASSVSSSPGPSSGGN